MSAPAKGPRDCGTHGCAAVATFVVFWPGQTTKKCAACRDQLSGIAKAMGFELDFRPLEPEKQTAPS